MNIVKRNYLGNDIEFKLIDGEIYANANTMTTSKKLENWKSSPNTKRYIEALQNNQTLNFREREFIISKRGGNVNEQGTWIHEKLILSLARYTSVEFELWCDEQIATLIREGMVELINDSYMISDPVKRALRWVEEETERIELRNAVEEMKPKADFVTKVFEPREGSIMIREFANMIYEKDSLEIGEKKLYKFLRDKGIVTKNNRPMQRFTEMGIFELKNSETAHKLITYVTNKGQTYLYDKIKKEYN